MSFAFHAQTLALLGLRIRYWIIIIVVILLLVALAFMARNRAT